MDERMDGKKRHILLLLFLTFTFPLLMYTSLISAIKSNGMAISYEIVIIYPSKPDSDLKIMKIELSHSQPNICCGCSKEPSR